jgi:hypothetical protein
LKRPVEAKYTTTAIKRQVGNQINLHSTNCPLHPCRNYEPKTRTEKESENNDRLLW